MDRMKITQASQAPSHLQRAAKVALSVGAAVFLSTDGESLMTQFNDADRYYFDPENVTLHMFEALGQARTLGLRTAAGVIRRDLIVLEFELRGVIAQIGNRPPHCVTNANTVSATRQALVYAFCDWYDFHVATKT